MSEATEQPVPATLAAALAKLQADLPDIDKRKTAKVPTKNGGEYSYKYADLADITKKVYPLLGTYGLSFTAKPTRAADGEFVLAYALLHVTGEREEGEYPLPDPMQSKAQEIGSAITYARRYSFCS